MTESLDSDALADWLRGAFDPSISTVEAVKLAGGHSSGAWRLDLVTAEGDRSIVLKAPGGESVVYGRDAAREGRILDGLSRAGAPVPAVVAIDADGAALGRAAFAMELVDGRSPEDSGIAGYHDDAWLQGLELDEQRSVWESYYDTLGRLHATDASAVPEASLGDNGLLDVVAYWRAALLDIAEAEAVPRQLALLDWLVANLPDGADDDVAVCMGDARFVNCLLRDGKATALIDFEVAYLGNPAADVGYSTFLDGMQRANAEKPLLGIGTADDAWARWSATSGRVAVDREFWTAFGAMVIAVTGTRAMVQWGLGGPDLEAINPLVPAWEEAVAAAKEARS